MYLVTVSVVVYTLFYTPCQIAAFEWTDSLPNGTQLEVCERSTATFPWGFHLAPGERVDTVSYHQQLQDGTPDNASESGQGDGMGTPIVSTDPHFTFTPDHQMIINRASANDTGNYVIKVMVVPAEETEAQPHVTRASLLVKVRPVLEEGGPGLQAKLQPQAIMVTDGPQPGWHVQLSCGTFLSLGQPAVTVMWTTPSGTVLPCTSYENGVFSLIVPNPVESGDYSCQVDPRAPVLDCISDMSPLRHQPAVRVNDMETRVILLEARDTEMATRDTERTTRNTKRTARDTELTARVNKLTDRVTELTARETELTARVTELTARDTELTSLLKDLATSALPYACKASQVLNPLSGVRTLMVGSKLVQAYCDQDMDGGGWTVIQRRDNGQVDFYRRWDEYARGFGDPSKEHWLGLENIHQMTSRAIYTLRVDLWDSDRNRVYAKYDLFSVDGESDKYRLNIIGYSGTAGDSMLNTDTFGGAANNMAFSTYDRDNDRWPEENCASRAHGAWWYDKCQLSNLNGRYFTDGRHDVTGLMWFQYKNDFRSFIRTEMKIRPRG